MPGQQEELERIGGQYLKPTPDRRVDQKFLDCVADFVISRLSGQRVLELGVGDQVWTPKLLARFPDVTSVDGSAGLLAAMEKKVGSGRWTPVVSMFEDYRPDRRFDLALATYVLEHVDDPAQIVGLARTAWLKPGGRLAIVVPHALSLHRRLAVKLGLAASPAQLGEADRRIGHKWCFTWFEMEKLLLDAGFRVLEKRGLITKALPNSLLVSCSDEQLRGLAELGLDLPIDYAGAIFFLAETK